MDFPISSEFSLISYEYYGCCCLNIFLLASLILNRLQDAWAEAGEMLVGVAARCGLSHTKILS